MSQPRKTSKTCQALLKKDKLISNVLLRTTTHGHTSVDQPAPTYIHQLCADTEFHLEDLTSGIATEIQKNLWCQYTLMIANQNVDWHLKNLCCNSLKVTTYAQNKCSYLEKIMNRFHYLLSLKKKKKKKKRCAFKSFIISSLYTSYF